MSSTKQTVSDNLEDVGLAADRFISVNDGEKKSVDHDTRYSRAENVPGTNYGIYADEDDQFFILDVDDHKDGEEKSSIALAALDGLPDTLEVKSPHVANGGPGGHRLFKLDGDQTPAELFKQRFGTKNPVPTWGEVVSKNKYCVGAGSQLDGCNKDWCENCETAGGGQYLVQTDRQVAVVDPEMVIEALNADPDLYDNQTENTTFVDVDASDIQSATAGDTITETNGNQDGGQDREYDDLDRDQVESMLREIPGDQHFDDWIRTGYAVFDWNPTSVGKEVFKNWSAGDEDSDFERNEKWENSDSQKQIDYIWSNGLSGDGDDEVSVGTLVHIAKEHGFEFENSPRINQNQSQTDTDDNKPGAVPYDPLVATDGVYGKWVPNRSDEDKEFDWETVTTFQLETVERLQTDDGERLTLRVHPSHSCEDSYEVDIHPKVFNEHRTFKEEVVRGRTTSFNGGQQELNALRKTVGVQDAPARIASEHIGLTGDSYNEWVAPNGTLTADKIDENPAYRYRTKGGSSETDGSALARKWQLDADNFDEYETETVAHIAELLPKTRRSDRGIPILGWFYAAPLRPLIHDWTDEFNLLQVIGSTGTGKTSTLKTYWEAFGMQPDPFSASDTTFTLTKHMSSSRGVPVWIDEYKPADIDDRRLDKLHRRLREVTKGTAVSKGRPNLGEVVFRLEAPVVVSGEQKFNRSIPAVRRRAIMTSLSAEATEDGSVYQRSFAQLTGTAYTDGSGNIRYPDGYNLSDHARAYYSFILNEDPEMLRERWKSAKERTAEILSDRGYSLQETEFRGLQTVLFGMRLHSKFATEHGVTEHKLPSSTEIADAFEHLASNIGKQGQRRGYDDIFLELFSQAASADYLEEDADFRFYESSKSPDDVLALHMPSVYAGVRRYVRDYNLNDEYNIIGKADYVSAFSDIAGDDSHVIDASHVVRLQGGRARCVVIHPERTQQRLGSDFDLRAYDQDAVTDADQSPDDAAEKNNDSVGVGSDTKTEADEMSEQDPLAALDVGHGKTVTATVRNVSDGEYNKVAQGMLEGPHETVISFVIPGGNDNPMPAYSGDMVRIDGATLRTDDDGLRELVINDGVDIQEADATDSTDTGGDDDTDGESDESSTQTPETTDALDSAGIPQSQSQSSSDSVETAADGGSAQLADVRERVAVAFEATVDDSTELADKMPLQRGLAEHCDDMKAAKELINKAKKEGWISEPASRRYRRESLPKVDQ